MNSYSQATYRQVGQLVRWDAVVVYLQMLEFREELQRRHGAQLIVRDIELGEGREVDLLVLGVKDSHQPIVRRGDDLRTCTEIESKRE